MNGGAFNDLTEIFESIIDWPKRLAHEEPFYRRLFERVGVRSVLDAACGTGRHAGMFHSWGLRVEGADLSPNMIARARAAVPEGVRWSVRGYDQIVDSGTPFDAVVCVGNSLALAADMAMAAKALERMLAAVRPGGVVVVHVLNLWALPDGPCLWQKAVQVTLADGPALIVKGVHRAGARGFIELLVLPLQGEVKMRTQGVPLLGLEAGALEQVLRQAGAGQVSLRGGYQDQAYGRDSSTDLLIVAER